MHIDDTARRLTTRDTVATVALFAIMTLGWLLVWWFEVVGRFDWLVLSTSPLRVMLAGLLLAGTGFAAVAVAWLSAVFAASVLSPPTGGRHR